MTPEQYAKLRELYHELIELSEDARAARVAELDARGLDTEVRDQLAEMLEFPKHDFSLLE